MNTFFEKFVMVAVMILLAVICWGIVKPALIDTRNFQVIGQALTRYEQVLTKNDADLKTIKQDISILKGKVFVEKQ